MRRKGRRWLWGAAALYLTTLSFAAACKKETAPSDDDDKPVSAPQEPSSTTPSAPATLSATDFCKLIYEAPMRTLAKACTAADKKSKRFVTLDKLTRERVKSCWALLSSDVQHKRVMLPAEPARRCAAAIEALPWHLAVERPMDTVDACRNVAVGLATTGQACRSSLSCGGGLYCEGGARTVDGRCAQPSEVGGACAKPSSWLLGQGEAGCGAGHYCDHGDAPPWDQLDRPPETHDEFPKKAAVTGRLPVEVVRRIMRAHKSRFRACYEAARRRDGSIEGRMAVRFTIDTEGAVSSVKTSGRLDAQVQACVADAVRNVMFPAPEGGVVRVVYPFVFRPDDGSGRVAPTPSGTSVGMSACKVLQNDGDACEANRECKTQHCVNGSCGRPAEEGATCRGTRDCNAALRCIADGPAPDDADALPPAAKCRAPGVAGASCRSDRECLGACTDGQCVAFCGR